MYEVFDIERPEINAMKNFFATAEEAEEHIGKCRRFDRVHPEETGGVPGTEYLGIRIVERVSQPCATCGAEAQNSPESYAKYPYCRTCHYVGNAAEHEHEADLFAFREAFPDANVGVEHTGGGCFWLAFRWEDDPLYYIATAGEAELPDDDRWDDGWGVVCAYMDDVEDDEGRIIAQSDHFGDNGDPTFLTKLDVIAAIGHDRFRVKEMSG